MIRKSWAVVNMIMGLALIGSVILNMTIDGKFLFVYYGLSILMGGILLYEGAKKKGGKK